MSNKNIIGILNFIKFIDLKVLDCSLDKITGLDKIISLDNLPKDLVKLNCSHNQITTLNNLPNSLVELNSSFNRIKILNNLSDSLSKLFCD